MQRPSWGRRLGGIEGLRALAATSVMAGHILEHSEKHAVFVKLLDYLASGLTLFFALSGFLLYRPFAAAIIRGEELPRLGAYLTNRGLRILPAYWLILIVLTLFAATNVTPSQIGHLWTDPGRLIANLGLLQGYYPGGVTTGIGPAWSLGAEVIFYLLLPMMVLATARMALGRSRNHRAAIALCPSVVLMIVGLGGNLWPQGTLHGGGASQTFGANWHSVLERSFLPSAWLFAPGIVAAVIVAQLEAGVSLRVPSRRIVGIAAVSVAIVAVAGHERGALDLRLYNLVMGIASGLAILYATLPSEDSGFALRLLEHRWVVYIGTISYSIYLWHEPVTKWLHAHGLMFNSKTGVILNLVIVISVVLVLASITYRFVERPANALKRRMTPSRASDVVAVAVGATVEAAP